MKFCLSLNQTKDYLAAADEIKLQYKDHEAILDLIAEYPYKDFIIDCFNADIDWAKMDNYNQLSKYRIILCLNNINQMQTANSLNIKNYLGFAIESFYELNAIMDLHPCYIIPGATLFFNMDALQKFNVPVRVIPNVAYNDALIHSTGVNGTWIRPEDLHSAYEDRVAAVEFADCDEAKERALFRIYAKEKEWRQDLNILISNLNYPQEVLGRLIVPEVGQIRLNCGHRCQMKENCHVCEEAFITANLKTEDVLKQLYV